MKKRVILIVSSIVVCIAIGVLSFIFLNKKDDSSEAFGAYCSMEYNAGFGNYGSFSVALGDDGELERNFNDLSKFTLGGAFTGMTVENVSYDEADECITFILSGNLAEGDYGTVEGKGILKNKSVKVDIPIARATASSPDTIYDNLDRQQVEIQLTSACFNKNLSAADFVLSGAAENMIIESVETDFTQGENGEDILSQRAVLTIAGTTKGTDYAYIKISDSATTFNKPLDMVILTDFCGAYVLNDHIDTYTLHDVVYIKADNISFNSKISKDNFSFDGSLKDYAVIQEVEFVNETMIELQLSFPYTFINTTDTIGYIKLNADTNTGGKELVCSTVVASPDIESELKIDGRDVKIELTLEHEKFNMLSPYPFRIYYPDGREIIVSGIDIVDLDEYLSISFTLPEGCEGLIYFELKDAYDIVKPDGSKENITIKTYICV